MKKSRYRKKINKKIMRITLCSLLGTVMIGCIVFFVSFRVTSVEVDGNHRYTADEIKEMVLKGPFTSNSVLFSLTDAGKNTKDIPFIKKITVERLSRNKIALHVVEEDLIGYVKFLDGCLYFDKFGVVKESTLEPLEGIPHIEGLEFGHVVMEDKLPVKNEEIFSTILSLSRMITKSEIQPDRILLSSKSEISLFFGDVEASLGDDSYMEEKITRLAAILPNLSGMQGILHLEATNGESKNITFEKTAEGDSSPSSESDTEQAENVEDNGDNPSDSQSE